MHKKQLMKTGDVSGSVPIFLALAIMSVMAGPCLAAKVNPSEVIVTNAGEEFVIPLFSNRATGFKWQLAEPADKNTLSFIRQVYVVGNAKLVGVGGKEVWTFKAVGEGKAALNFQYVRLREKNISVAKIRKLVVIVKKKAEPLIYNGVKYISDKMNYIEARDPRTNDRFWKLKVFNPAALQAEDTQLVWITDLSIEGGKLIAATSANDKYEIDLYTKQIKKI